MCSKKIHTDAKAAPFKYCMSDFMLVAELHLKLLKGTVQIFENSLKMSSANSKT
jgi:hypothetical protein